MWSNAVTLDKCLFWPFNHRNTEENFKIKAEESISRWPIKIIRTELLNSSSTSNISSQNVRNVRKAIYDKQKQTYPKLPTSMDKEAIYQLKNLQNEECFKYKDRRFIYIPNNDKFVYLTTEQNIKFMTNNCIENFADGTFNYASKYFIQIYTIHGYKNGYYLAITCLLFFLQNKTRSSYD
ncbi:hypothetical protein AGLY_012100 [Aphis glycines]|uniref:MULE transposase domain-containing protein n=1 Tax=Aphis glycines TaxID=307491 RepID=A0A6G0T9H2_APHGL|nr:hypothetical protein AGLY_012100 [Aphis glycines]